MALEQVSCALRRVDLDEIQRGRPETEQMMRAMSWQVTLQGRLRHLVMPGLVPGIHVLAKKQGRGWPGQSRP